MANRYAVGTGNWGDTSTWSTTSGGATGASVPTAADDVFLDANTTALTINGGATRSCRSINCTGFTGTLTKIVDLNIGDSTAGASNIALKFVSGMTLADNGGQFIFNSTSATIQEVDFAGKSTRNVVFQGAGSSYQYTGAHNADVLSSSTVTLTQGTLDINGQTCSWGAFNSNNLNTRTLTLGAANITITGTGESVWFLGSTNSTLNGGTSTITFTGSNSGIIGGTGNDYYNVVATGSGSFSIPFSLLCENFTRTGTSTKTDTLSLASTITCSGTFTANGNSATNRLLIQSNSTGTSRTITAATVSVTNSDFQDITGAGAGSWDLSAITGNSGDCGGNSGITFTTPTTQTCTMSTNKNWDDVTIWTSRVPLPQDNISGANITGGQLNTNGMPRLGKDINWTGATGGFAWGFNITNPSIFGSITLVSGMTAIGGSTITLEGRGTHTITSAGVSISPPTQISSIGGSYTLQDALSIGGNFTFNQGTFDANDFNVTCLTFSSSNNNTRTIDMGAGVWSLTGTSGTIWNIGTGGNLTFSGSSSTITVTSTSSSTRTIVAALTFGILNYTVAGSTGTLALQGNGMTWNTLNFSDASNARTLQFFAGHTFNFTTFNVQGTSGKLMTVKSHSNGNTYTLSKSSGIVSCDYLSIQDSTATGGATWYAGANSTSVSGNSGWIFEAAPAGVTGNRVSEMLYGAYATKTGLSGVPLSVQKLSFYNSELGTNYHNVNEAERAFLKDKTGLNINHIDHLWRSYMVSRGVTHKNSFHDMMFEFLSTYGFE